MARENLKRSDEEEDTLIRSTKKFKENHIPGVEHDSNPSTNNSSKGGSYRDKLIGAIPGAFEQTFGFSNYMQEDSDSDTEAGENQGEDARITLSKEEKVRKHLASNNYC